MYIKIEHWFKQYIANIYQDEANFVNNSSQIEIKKKHSLKTIHFLFKSRKRIIFKVNSVQLASSRYSLK